jgi:hypothetical protein
MDAAFCTKPRPLFVLPRLYRITMRPLKHPSLLLTLAAGSLLLAGCTESSPTPDNHPLSTLSIPDKSDNPPVTMSGYVDTSTTTQVK